MSTTLPSIDMQNPEVHQLAGPDKMRALFAQSLDRSNSNSDRFASEMKVMGLGLSRDTIISAVSQIGQFTNHQSFVQRLVGKIPGLGKVAEKMQKSVEETIIEGKSVKDVATELVSSLTSKRDQSVQSALNLQTLAQDMTDNYDQLQEIADRTKDLHDTAPQHLKLGYSSLLIEIIETMDLVKGNVQSAIGTVKATELSVQQVSGLIPKIRAILQDSMVVRQALQELEEQGQMVDILSETCRVIRDDNFVKMESVLMGVLDRSVLSNDQIKQLENSSKRGVEFQRRIEAKLVDVNTRQIAAVKSLTPLVQNQIGVETREFLLQHEGEQK